MKTQTKQQKDCVDAIKSPATKKLKIDAGAGAGKTSTLEMIAQDNLVSSLYLAFNKVTADEATVRFPKHVQCQTTHSKAYAAFGSKLRDKLKRPTGGYVNVAGTGSEIGRYYKLSAIELSKDCTASSAFLGLLVRQTVAKFEQSADEDITKDHLPWGELKNLEKKSGASISYLSATLLSNAKKLWKDRINPNSPVLATHDTYLKLYQLSKPVFNGVEILYVDEYQDTTPCVHDIVQRQDAHMKIVMVGDPRQAIYGWRGAVNAMNMVQCETKPLTKSFRYGQAVADIATAVLEGSVKLEGFEKIDSVVGMECVDRSKPYTRLFRTNMALLMAAVEELSRGSSVRIEVDVKDLAKMLESAVALYDCRMKDVKHEKLLAFEDWKDLAEESQFDGELNRLVKVVTNGDGPKWVRLLTSHVNPDNPHITFTTAHKSKGREWSQVVLESDFKSCYNEEGWVGLPTEEQNLLYVACTRAINVLEYNHTVHEYLMRERSYDSMTNEEAHSQHIEQMYDQCVRKTLKNESKLVMDMVMT